MTHPESNSEQIKLNLEHAKAGYTVAQETIKFIDTKTGIMTGVLVITTGLPFLLMNFVASDEGKDTKELLLAHPIFTCLIAFALLLGLAFGTMSLMSGTNGLMARTPVRGDVQERGLFSEAFLFLLCKLRLKQRTSPPFTITSLFPLYPPDRTTEALQRFSCIGGGSYSSYDVLREYEVQIGTIGSILNRKVERNRDAVRWFELQLLSYALAMSVAIILTAVAIVRNGTKAESTQRSSEEKPRTVPQPEVRTMSTPAPAVAKGTPIATSPSAK